MPVHANGNHGAPRSRSIEIGELKPSRWIPSTLVPSRRQQPLAPGARPSGRRDASQSFRAVATRDVQLPSARRQSRVDEVRVSVDEPRQDGSSPRVDPLGVDIRKPARLPNPRNPPFRKEDRIAPRVSPHLAVEQQSRVHSLCILQVDDARGPAHRSRSAARPGANLRCLTDGPPGFHVPSILITTHLHGYLPRTKYPSGVLGLCDNECKRH